jgi:hypothetical protein
VLTFTKVAVSGLIAGGLVVAGTVAPAVAVPVHVAASSSTKLVATSVKAADVTLKKSGSTKVTVTVTLNRALTSSELGAVLYGPKSAADPIGAADLKGSGKTLKASFSVKNTAKVGTWQVEAGIFKASDVYLEHPLVDKSGYFHVKLATAVSLHVNHAKVSKSATVSVSGGLQKLAVSKSSAKYVADAKQTVKIYFDPSGKSPKKLVGTVKTNSKGQFSKHVKATASGTFTATYAGTSTYAAKTSSSVKLAVK